LSRVVNNSENRQIKLNNKRQRLVYMLFAGTGQKSVPGSTCSPC